ncbi:MAG: FGGY family carbohydrate kinase [Bacilli bacterium]|jgi:sugar (pentulose or hexulose) kinase|nr:FGGY family carbohydrate kinase [Bacilli bacterium]
MGNSASLKTGNGQYWLGIELGSTRIKCCLVDRDGQILSTGVYLWENVLVDGFWSYSLEKAVAGVGKCYLSMKRRFKEKTGLTIECLSGIGVSAMMHGLIAVDAQNDLLCPFRTWRCNNAEEEASILSSELNFNIPARWSIAQLFYSVRRHEEFVPKIDRIFTLASYIHHRLTGAFCVGKTDASGIFPLSGDGSYDRDGIELTEGLFRRNGCSLELKALFPPTLNPGENAGSLTEEGRLLLDPEGDLRAGVPFCPPEGDAATGLVCTNSIKKGNGNISAGTSVFGSFVLGRNLSKVYPEIDVITTPDGNPAAMIHCNNCTAGINQVMDLAEQTLSKVGVQKSKTEIFEALLQSVLDENNTLDHQVYFNFLSGENLMKVGKGAMLFASSQQGKMTIDSIVLGQLFAAFATFSLGKELLDKENIVLDTIFAHGGVFNVEGVAGVVLASAINHEIYLNHATGEGGAWGMALLSLYSFYKDGMSLCDFLDSKAFSNHVFVVQKPNRKTRLEFLKYRKRFVDCLEAERFLGEALEKC